MARAWLDHLRQSASFKLEDLDVDQLRWKPAATANSLGEIVVHLGFAERLWVRVILAGEEMDMPWRKRMFTIPPDWTGDDVVAFYRQENTAVDSVLNGASSFDLRSAGASRPTTCAGWCRT
jgi:hypothetical protein